MTVGLAWLSRPDDWVINRKMTNLSFWNSSEQLMLQSHTTTICGRCWRSITPILTGLRALTIDREWEVVVVPLVVGQRSVKVKEWLEILKVFGMEKKRGRRFSRD